MLNGLYKVEYGINGAFGRSIMCMHDGKLLGGNSAFAHLGTYDVRDGAIEANVITERHNDDPNYKPLMGADVATIKVHGRTEGSTILFEGKADPMPGSVFWANLAPLDDEALPPRGTVGPGGIINGLYSIHLRALDGVEAGLSGVMLLMDGRILGGDAFFYYLGSYSSGAWPLEGRDAEPGAYAGERRQSRVWRPGGGDRLLRDLHGRQRRARRHRARRQAQPAPCRLAQADAASVGRGHIGVGYLFPEAVLSRPRGNIAVDPQLRTDTLLWATFSQVPVRCCCERR